MVQFPVRADHQQRAVRRDPGQRLFGHHPDHRCGQRAAPHRWRDQLARAQRQRLDDGVLRTAASHTLATTTGTYFIDPYTETNGDPHSFIGLTFNGQTLAISGGKVTGNAATTGLLDTLNTYLANQPQLTVSDVTVNEDGGYATLTVALSKASTDTVTVKYTTQPGTATAGSDYTATSGTLTFSPGQTTKTVQIAITDDALAEGDETFSLVLSDSSFAAITDNTGVITIRDNDVTQSVTGISVGPAVTEGANLVYTVALNVPSPTPVELHPWPKRHGRRQRLRHADPR